MKRVIKLFIVILAALLICSCSDEEDAEQESGVKYYTAKNISNVVTVSEIDEHDVTAEDIKIAETEEILKSNDVVEEATDISKESPGISNDNSDELVVYVTPSGKKYHYIKTCPGKNSTATTLNKAIASGKEPCKKCVD